ncbi:MAG: Nif3-like dinuclear metal center hexameric protein [Thermodesulfobacteriota bacterium]
MTAEPLTVSTLQSLLDGIAPFSLAESWDNVGLQVGDPRQEVNGILVALDPTEAVIQEAIDRRLHTIVTHHPLLFHPLKSLHTDTPIGRILKAALRHDLTLIACHTNLDLMADGVSEALASRLGLTATRPLAPSQTGADRGFGRIGDLSAPQTGATFLANLPTAMGAEGVRLAGRLPATVRTVALCGGSGSELAETARAAGADLYITGEVKHSTARWTEDAGFCVIDAGHFATENPVVPILAEALRNACHGQGFTPTIAITGKQTDPWQWVVPSRSKIT